MDEDGGTGAIPLIDTSSERVIGKVSLDLCDEEHQIVIQRIEPKEPDAPVSLLSEALTRGGEKGSVRRVKGVSPNISSLWG
jgi:hypothetical protein